MDIVNAENLKIFLQNALQPNYLEVYDDSHLHQGHQGAKMHGGGHYRIKIQCEIFRGQSRVAIHRKIYAVLQPYMKQHIHALAIEVLAF